MRFDIVKKIWNEESAGYTLFNLLSKHIWVSTTLDGWLALLFFHHGVMFYPFKMLFPLLSFRLLIAICSYQNQSSIVVTVTLF